VVATTPESGGLAPCYARSRRTGVAVRSKVRLTGGEVGHLISCDLSAVCLLLH